MKKFVFLVTMLIGIVLLAVIILYLNTPRQPIAGMITPKILPAFQLVDHHGQKFTEQQLKNNQWKLLYFGYTHCPDICPTTLSMLQNMKKQLPDNYAKDTQFIFISFDTERDTPEALKSYLSFFDPSFLGLTGEKQQAEQLTKMLRVVYLKVAHKDSYLIDHSATIYLINPQGEWMATFYPPFEALALAKHYQQIRDFLSENKPHDQNR